MVLLGEGDGTAAVELQTQLSTSAKSVGVKAAGLLVIIVTARN